MGIEKKVKEVAEQRQASEAEIQAALQSEKEAEKSTQEQQFQKNFQDRQNLQNLLENFQSTATGVAEAKKERKQSAGKIDSAIEDLEEDPDEKTTLREVLENATEEDKATDTVEAGYFNASTNLKDARQSALQAREALRSAGLDAERKSDAELAQEVQVLTKQKQSELEAFVRAHPDSELPEAKEMREEMVQNLTREILKKSPGIRGFENVLGGIARNFKRDPKELINDNPLRANELRRNLTYAILKNTAEANGFDGLVKSIGGVAEDPLAHLAVAQALKQTIFNYEEDAKGNVKHSDVVYSYNMNNFAGVPLYLARVYDAAMGEEKLPDDVFYTANGLGRNEKGEREGLKAEAGPLLANVLDSKQMEEFSKRILEITNLTKRVENWGSDKNKIAEEIDDLEDREESIKKDGERIVKNIESLARSIPEKREKVEKLQRVSPELVILATDIPEDEGVTVESSYGELNINFSSDKIAREELGEENDANYKKAEQGMKDAGVVLSEARNQKPGFLGSGKDRIARGIQEAEAVLKTAEKEFESVKEENTRKWDELNQNLSEKRAAIREKLSEIKQEISGEIFRGSWKEFMEGVTARTSQNVERILTEISEAETRLIVLENEKAVNSENLTQIQERATNLKSSLDRDFNDFQLPNLREKLASLRKV